MISLIVALVVSSTVSTSSVAEEKAPDPLATCNERVEELRESMKKIAAAEDDVVSHWPAILSAAVCIGGVSFLAEKSDDFNEAATASAIAACGGLGFVVDGFTWSPPD